MAGLKDSGGGPQSPIKRVGGNHTMSGTRNACLVIRVEISFQNDPGFTVLWNKIQDREAIESLEVS